MESTTYIRSKYTASVLDAMDTMVLKSLFSFDSLEGTREENYLDVLQDALYLYKNKDCIKTCKLCRRSELILEEWYNDMICMNCYTKRNNRTRIQELLRQ